MTRAVEEVSRRHNALLGFGMLPDTNTSVDSMVVKRAYLQERGHE